jgi:hypothetical protein
LQLREDHSVGVSSVAMSSSLWGAHGTLDLILIPRWKTNGRSRRKGRNSSHIQCPYLKPLPRNPWVRARVHQPLHNRRATPPTTVPFSLLLLKRRAPTGWKGIRRRIFPDEWITGSEPNINLEGSKAGPRPGFNSCPRVTESGTSGGASIQN